MDQVILELDYQSDPVGVSKLPLLGGEYLTFFLPQISAGIRAIPVITNNTFGNAGNPTPQKSKANKIKLTIDNETVAINSESHTDFP
jgi:hypothetical protein